MIGGFFMFVYSVRASSLKFFGLIALVIIAVICLIVLLPGSASKNETESVFINGETVRYDGVKTNDGRKSFLSQFGWETSSEPVEEEIVTIPDNFDKIFTGYNAIQKQQGMDLEKYRKKEMTRYTYEITNYPDYDGVVYANILVYRDKVVGGDICSARSDGFVHGFEKTDG